MQRTASSIIAVAALAFVALTIWGEPSPTGNLGGPSPATLNEPNMAVIRAVMVRDVQLDLHYNESSFGRLDWSLMELRPRVAYSEDIRTLVQDQLIECPSEGWCAPSPNETARGMPPNRDLKLLFDADGFLTFAAPVGAKLESIGWSDGDGQLVIRGCGGVSLRTDPAIWRVHPPGPLQGRILDEDLLLVIPVGATCVTEG